VENVVHWESLLPQGPALHNAACLAGCTQEYLRGSLVRMKTHTPAPSSHTGLSQYSRKTPLHRPTHHRFQSGPCSALMAPSSDGLHRMADISLDNPCLVRKLG
jgi:hypothetical protein